MSSEKDEALDLNFLSEEKIENVDPDELKPDPNQPRQTWTTEVLDDVKKLAETFLVQGVIEPVEVDEHNVIIRGERRWRAALIVKHEKGEEGFKLPIKRKMGLNPKERFERQLIDDAHRRDMNPIDRAWAYATAVVSINTGEYHALPEVKNMDKQNLLVLIGLAYEGRGNRSGQSELSRRIGVSQPTISQYLKLIRLPESLQGMVNDEVISLSTGCFLADLSYEKLWDAISMWISLQEEHVTENQVREMLDIIDPFEAEVKLTDYPDKLDLLILRAGKNQKTSEEWKKSVNELIEGIKREHEKSQRQIDDAFKALDEPPKTSTSTPEPPSEIEKLAKEFPNMRVDEFRDLVNQRIPDELPAQPPPPRPSLIHLTNRDLTLQLQQDKAIFKHNCPKCKENLEIQVDKNIFP